MMLKLVLAAAQRAVVSIRGSHTGSSSRRSSVELLADVLQVGRTRLVMGQVRYEVEPGDTKVCG